MGLANRPNYCWVVLGAGTLAVFGALGLARYGYTVVLPAMQTGLGLDNTQTGALATANLAGYLALAAIGGALASRLGARLVIVAGLVVAAGGMLLTGTADSFLTVALWRCLTGLGSGAANIGAMGMLTAWFPASRRGLATGIAVTGSSVAIIALGPVVPTLLARQGSDGWRACWYLFGAATLVIAVVCLLLVRNRVGGTAVDLSAAYGGRGKAAAPHASRGWGAVYRSRPVWHLGLVYVAFGFSYIIYMTFFVKHLMAAGGYSRAAAGSLFMVMGWASLICGLFWGSVSDRIGRKRTLVIVYLIHSISFALFGLWPAPAGFTLSALLYGVTAWSIPAIMAAACGDILGPRLAPAALGFITLFFGIGQAIGPSIAGIIADRAGSFVPALLLASFVALLGGMGAATLHPAPAPELEAAGEG